MVKTQDILGFVVGSTPPPPQFISTSISNNGEMSTIPNPAYHRWIQKDQDLLGTLMSSFTEGVLDQMVGYSTSRKVLLALEKCIYLNLKLKYFKFVQN